MPVDYRRILCPENTVPYIVYSKSDVNSLYEKISESVQVDVRLDGRKSSEQRKIFLKCGVVSKAKGSAYIEIDNTKLIVSVYDPREIPKKSDYSVKGELYCEFKYATFSCPKRRSHQQDTEEKQYSAILKRALESAVCCHEFPNLQVDIYVLVLENNGSALSAAITASGLALAHAGIPMYDIIASATLGIQGNFNLLDPTLEEENFCDFAIKANGVERDYDNHGIIVLSMLSTHEQVTEFYQTGNLHLNNLKEAIKILTKAIKDIIPLVEKCLVKHVVMDAKQENQD